MDHLLIVPIKCFFLLWHWFSVENTDRKTSTAIRMIITLAQLMSVRCFVINFFASRCFFDRVIATC